MKKILTLLFLSLSLSNPVFADKGYDYYQQGDYKSAAIEWTKEAKKGSRYAQNRLGELYRSGKGVTKDLEQAIYWFKESANQDYPRAQLHLGWYYYYGKGVNKNYNQALYWWRKAIKGDNDSVNLEGRYWLALAYYGVKDFYDAGLMFKSITDRNNGDSDIIARSQYMMGKMYERGEHFDKNIEISKRWYTKASLSENDDAKKALKRIAKEEKNKKARIAQQKKIAEIAEQNRLTKLAEKKRLAKISETKRQSEIAEQNRLARIAKAKKELEIAKQKRIGLKAYNEGSYDLALKELKPVAKSGDAEAQKIYGTIAYKGTASRDKNFEIALIVLNRAAIQGQLDAYWTIADIYSKGGYGVLKNPRKAFNSYEKLARNGNSRAQHKIGLLYLNGDGVEKSLRDASYWVQKSFDNDGNKDAEKTWNKYKLWNY
ncbi:hypothetical protein OAE24_05180 [Candidatus Thioglobus sp.]|nr:hypothetical protein [Candidatus Thioglobus sp.]